MKQTERNILLKDWIESSMNESIARIETASSDASFRSYYRVILRNEDSFIAVDSPPQYENNQQFIKIAKILFEMNIPVPKIINGELNLGFLIISDLGKDTMLSKLTSNDEISADYYNKAISFILKIQENGVSYQSHLPLYDRDIMLDEMKLFIDWYCKLELKINRKENQVHEIYSIFKKIADKLDKQKKVFVHRDFHSRNIMIGPNNQLGIIDFQDATLGPITYDLVSLLKDCYIVLPEAFVLEKVEKFFHKISPQISLNQEEFIESFDLMGVQRHLKAIGIFSRLKYRDNKENYIEDIPRTREYLIKVTKKYTLLKPLYDFLKQYP